MDSPSSSIRSPCFNEESNGLASIASAMDSPALSFNHHHHHHLLSRPIYPSPPIPRRNSLRNLSRSFSSVSSSPRSGRFYSDRFDEQQEPHFLDSCFLCKKSIGDNRDIFMYRGDTPFCSEECRGEQIERDEAKEKKWNLKASMKALRYKEENEKSTNKNTQDYPFHSGAVAAV